MVFGVAASNSWTCAPFSPPTVDFAEFMKMMARNGTSTAAEIKESFSLFNKSGSGAITAGELRAVLDALGEKYKPEVCAGRGGGGKELGVLPLFEE